MDKVSGLFFIKTLFVLLLLNVSCLFSQENTWQKNYNGPLHYFDGGKDICLADSNNIYIIGYTSVSTPFRKIWILKINNLGDTIWTRIIGHQLASTGYACTSTSDGGCVITGNVLPGYGSCIKLNSSGFIDWEKNYGEKGTYLYDIIRTSDAGFICCGKINFKDGFILKLDSTGNFQWQKIYSINGTKVFYKINYGINGGYVITGFDNQDSVNFYSTITKVNDSGIVIWSKKNKSGGGNIFSINNGYIVGGSIYEKNTFHGYGFINVDTSGNIRTKKIIDSINYYGDITLINPRKYVMVMGTEFNMSLLGVVLLCDSSGLLIKRKILPPTPVPDYLELYSVLSGNNGNIYTVGVSDFNNDNFEDVYVANLDSMLNVSQLTQIKENENLSHKNFQILSNYPNPFNNSTIIIYELKYNSFIKLDLFDLSGKLIKILDQDYKEFGSHRYTLNDVSLSLASGVYFIRLSDRSNNSISKKIMFIK